MSKIEKYNHILTGFGSNILGNLLMFATTIFLTRSFEPEVYGEFRLIFSFIALIVIIFLLGRDNGIIYFTQHNKTYEDKIIIEETFFGLFILLIGTLILYIFGKQIIDIFLNQSISIENYNLSLLMIPLWGFFNLLLAGIKAKGMINYSFVLSNLTQRVLRIPFFILLALLSTSYYSLALGMILSQILLVYLAVKKVPFVRNIKEIDFRNFFTRFSYALQLGFNAIVVVLLTKIDVIMVGKFTDNEQVAIYDTSALLAFVVMLPFIALVKSTEPFMKSLIIDKTTQEKYYKNLKLSFELSLAVLLLFLISSEAILNIFGSVYAQGASTLIILSLGFVALIFLGTPIELLNMNGKGKISSIILLFSIGINILLNYLLIPNYGIDGAAVATVVSLIFSKIIGLFLVLKEYSLNLLNIKVSKYHFILLIFLIVIGAQISINNLYLQLSIGVFASILFLFFIVLTNRLYREKIYAIFAK